MLLKETHKVVHKTAILGTVSSILSSLTSTGTIVDPTTFPHNNRLVTLPNASGTRNSINSLSRWPLISTFQARKHDLPQLVPLTTLTRALTAACLEYLLTWEPSLIQIAMNLGLVPSFPL
jgi:hypothetical protein